MSFEQMWRDLEPVGRVASGGYFRQPFTPAERELHAWFLAAAADRGLRVETDPYGNTVAWWDPPPGEAERPAVLTGSHLDSVLEGGAYDGPLGVVSALAAVDLLRERGFVPDRPVGVSVFVEEEGSRFGLATLGSRLATGRVSWDDARSLRDRDGIALGDAIEGGPRSGWLDQVGVFLELHVEQGRALVDRDAAVGAASGIWPHGRYRFEFTGRSDHAGTTRMEDRHDPMLTYAMTALAANKQARLAGQRATFARVQTEPNGTNVIPHAVTAWLDGAATWSFNTSLARLTAPQELWVATDDPDAALRRITAAFPAGGEPDRVFSIAGSTSEFSSRPVQVGLVAILFVGAATSVVLALAGVTSYVLLAVARRAREMGVLRALGLQRREVAATFAIEQVVVVGLGAVIGTLGGIALMWSMLPFLQLGETAEVVEPPIRLTAPWPSLAGYVAIVGVLLIVSVVWSTRRVSARRMSEVLREVER